MSIEERLDDLDKRLQKIEKIEKRRKIIKIITLSLKALLLVAIIVIGFYLYGYLKEIKSKLDYVDGITENFDIKNWFK